MSATKKPLDEEYARRTICRDHANGQCSRKYGCKFNHDLVETSRLEGLLGDPEVLRKPQEYLTLEYVGSFEAFGHHECWGEGWRITLKARERHGYVQTMSPALVVKEENINKAITKLEDELRWQGFSTGGTENKKYHGCKNTVCVEFQGSGTCIKGEACKNSHTLIDMRPIKATVGSPGWYAPEETFFILQFLVEEGSPGPWKISLQAMQGSPGGSLYRLPVPLTKAGEDLFTILRHVPTMGKMAEARPLKPVVQAATSIPNHTQQPRRFLGAQQGLANSTGTVGSSIAAPPIQQAANKTHLPHHQNASPPATKTTRLPVLVPAPPAQSPSHTIAAAPVKSSPHPTAVGPTRITVTNSQLAPPQRSSYSTMHHGQPVQQEQWGYARPDHLAPAIRPVTAAPATARSSPTVYPTYDITTNRAANQPSKSQYHTPRTATYGTTPQRLANPSVNQPSDSTWQYHTTPTTNFPVHGASPANQSSRSAQYHATRPATSSSGYYQSRSTNHTNQTPAAANGDHPGHSAPDGENDSSTYSTIATFTAIFGGAVLVLHAFRTWL